MGTGEFPTPQAVSIPMRYAVLLRDLRLSVPVFDDNFNPEEFATIFGALKGLQVRMVNFEHNLDKIELGMSKLEHRIDKMELHMEQLQKELDGDPDSPSPTSQHHHDVVNMQMPMQINAPHFYLEDRPPSSPIPIPDVAHRHPVDVDHVHAKLFNTKSPCTPCT
ncbi:hypothetical protein M758_9G007500 [Ceratodon purpureus]|uniref:Uncharacterized protein n=1 Tax=Ceratodon purpureus TaxID=3225 RepID=A0A8T0GR95_CERPU|nr:hypothetical protein KC19_9G007900 [Ceratodon purpureus]KAG0604786.1 hypothetical protein M758_9G007500 [Ceratodon purpureus]